jgi:hypothetical protein
MDLNGLVVSSRIIGPLRIEVIETRVQMDRLILVEMN